MCVSGSINLKLCGGKHYQPSESMITICSVPGQKMLEESFQNTSLDLTQTSLKDFEEICSSHILLIMLSKSPMYNCNLW